jgi:hypothetical protein
VEREEGWEIKRKRKENRVWVRRRKDWKRRGKGGGMEGKDWLGMVRGEIR